MKVGSFHIPVLQFFFSPAFTAFTASTIEAQASFFFSRDTVFENLAGRIYWAKKKFK